MFLPKPLSAILLALILSMSLGLTACGGSSSSDSTTPVSTGGGDSGGGDSGGGSGGGDSGGGSGGGDSGGGDSGGGDSGGGDSGGGDSGGGAAFSGVNGPLDPVQTQLSALVGDQVGGALPAPLGSTVQCADEAVEALVDAPDALLAAFASLPGGADPAGAFNAAASDITATMQVFAAKLQSALMILAGQGTACDSGSVGGNPFAGTPLEPLGTPLTALLNALNAAGDGGNGGDPNLSVVVATITPLIDQLEAAFGTLPADLTGAPVVGGVLSTVEDALGDLSGLLTAAGDYDAAATETAIETLLNNALGNVLLGVLPVAAIDSASGQTFATEIQNGINTLTAALGDGLGMLITPAFNDGLDGALSPILDPVEGLLTALLANGLEGNPLGDTGNPLDGILGVLAGNGVSPLDSLLAMLVGGADGTPLAGLVGGLPDGGTGTPLDDLLVLLDAGNATELDSILGALDTLFGDNPLGGILDGILGGLGGLL